MSEESFIAFSSCPGIATDPAGLRRWLAGGRFSTVFDRLPQRPTCGKCRRIRLFAHQPRKHRLKTAKTVGMRCGHPRDMLTS
jgi:hypothetical protein